MAGHCRGLTSQVKVNGSGCRLRGMSVKNNWICLKMVRPFFPLNGLFGAKKRHAILRQIYYISWTIIRKMVLGHILASQRGYPCRMPMVLSKMVPTRMTIMMMMWLLLQIPRLSPPELQQLQFRHLCPPKLLVLWTKCSRLSSLRVPRLLQVLPFQKLVQQCHQQPRRANQHRRAPVSSRYFKMFPMYINFHYHLLFSVEHEAMHVRFLTKLILPMKHSESIFCYKSWRNERPSWKRLFQSN